MATVTRVDAGQGQLEFTTETGSFLLTTPPTEIDDLRVGDQLLICLHEEVRDGKRGLHRRWPRSERRGPLIPLQSRSESGARL